MNENTVETPQVVATKFDVLKNKVTREGLILTGVVAGIIIAGGFALLRKQPSTEITILEPFDAVQLTGDVTLSVVN